MATMNPFGYLEFQPVATPKNPLAGLGSATATAMLEFLKNRNVKSALEDYQYYSGDEFKGFKPKESFAEAAKAQTAKDKEEYETLARANAPIFGKTPEPFDEQKGYEQVLEGLYAEQFGGDSKKRKRYEDVAKKYANVRDEFGALEGLATELEPWNPQMASRYSQMAMQGRAKRDNEIRAVLSDYRNEWEKNAEQIYANSRKRTDLEYKIATADDAREKQYYKAQLAELEASDRAARERANNAATFASETAGRIYGKEEADRLLKSMARFDIGEERKVEEAEEPAAEGATEVSYQMLAESLAKAKKDGSFQYGYGEEALNDAVRDFAQNLGYDVNRPDWAKTRKSLIENIDLRTKAAPKAPTASAKDWAALPETFSRTFTDDEADALAALYNEYKGAGGKMDAKVPSEKRKSLFSRLGSRFAVLNLDTDVTFADFFAKAPAEVKNAFLVAMENGKGFSDFRAMLPRTASAPAAPAAPAPETPAPKEPEAPKEDAKARLGIKRRS